MYSMTAEPSFVRYEAEPRNEQTGFSLLLLLALTFMSGILNIDIQLL